MSEAEPPIEESDEFLLTYATMVETIKSRTEYLLVAASTVVWYWASSSSAVASQQTVALCSETCNPLLTMMSLCCYQIILGAILSLSVLFVSSPSTVTLRLPQKWTDVLLGSLHFVGFGLTNAGYAFGSASLVQTVKMLEPIETLILTALVNVMIWKRPTGVTRRMILATLMIITGTVTILSQKKAMKPNPWSILAALGSGMVMSGRNVIKKLVAEDSNTSYSATSDTETSEGEHEHEHSPPVDNTMKGKFVRGITSFYEMSLAACGPAIICWIPLWAYGHHSALWVKPAILAAFTHALYNAASIVVLDLVSAPTHSLLNAGKRISNVLFAAMVFSVPLGSGGKAGILLASMGALVYTGVSWIQIRYVFLFSVLLFLMTEWVSLQGESVVLEHQMDTEASNLLLFYDGNRTR